MEFDIDINGHHLAHEGKLPEAQEFLLQGHVPIFEEPSDHASQLEVLRKTNKLLDRYLVAVPITTANVGFLAWKIGLGLYGTQIISGEGELGGISAYNAGTTGVYLFVFDGNDAAAGTLLFPLGVSSFTASNLFLPIPIKFNNGLFIGFAGTAANIALTTGSIHIIRE